MCFPSADRAHIVQYAYTQRASTGSNQALHKVLRPELSHVSSSVYAEPSKNSLPPRDENITDFIIFNQTHSLRHQSSRSQVTQGLITPGYSANKVGSFHANIQILPLNSIPLVLEKHVLYVQIKRQNFPVHVCLFI